MSFAGLKPLFSTSGALPQISESVRRDADTYREAFLHAEPFKHVVIENFFEPSFAERLLADFPAFDSALARNEFGGTGRKASQTNIREISPVYQELYAFISSEPFLKFVSRLSGIPDLILDPKMYGGGTHDNLHGQELDPHVDFNYDEAQQLHRRLNLIVYMNKDWKTEWGGALEIHSNPRNPQQNRIEAYDPLFNRCVMFETNEYSWHGFPKINLPEDQRGLSRKSISIYLYTRDRPAEEIAPMHGTFYVQRPLPKHLAAGYTLTEQDVADIQLLLTRRDQWIEFYQRMELEKNREIAAKAHMVREFTTRVRAPLTGYILQEGAASGLYHDGWSASLAELEVRPLLPVSGITVVGWRPKLLPAARVCVSLDDAVSIEATVRKHIFKVHVPLSEPRQEKFRVKISFAQESKYKAPGDDRDLAFVLHELRAHHPGISGP
jgi:Rps23 Pro-64 3,4-dihydroxylase Tpa1-like proline 4-hydroxylase